jgi:hypothetical protein
MVGQLGKQGAGASGLGNGINHKQELPEFDPAALVV